MEDRQLFITTSHVILTIFPFPPYHRKPKPVSKAKVKHFGIQEEMVMACNKIGLLELKKKKLL